MTAFARASSELTPEDAHAGLIAGTLQLIDVREDYEWVAAHVPGSLHIAIEHVAERADEIDRSRPVVFLCLGGVRSALVTEAFRSAGYDASNVTGGLRAWVERGLPIEPPDGTVAPHGAAPS